MSFARAQRNSFPQAELDREINARFLLNEHGDPHILMHELKLHEVTFNKTRLEEKFKNEKIF